MELKIIVFNTVLYDELIPYLWLYSLYITAVNQNIREIKGFLFKNWILHLFISWSQTQETILNILII